MSRIWIRNAIIYDGTGKPPYTGNVCIEQGRIVQSLSGSPDETVDASGLCIAPGFIDTHTHSDYCLGYEYNSLSRVSQGITTQVAGQCGKSVPVRNREMFDELTAEYPLLPCPGHDTPKQFETFKGYLDYVNHLPMVENSAFFIGHGNLRRWVMGYESRMPTPAEMAQMKSMLAEAMDAGAIGLSSGLIYPPGVYSQIDEMAELCSVLRRYDGIYTTHIRSEGDRVLEAVNEAIEVARRSGCRLNISHLKVCGKNNEGLSKDILVRIDAARRQGIRISADQYPYDAGATGLSVCIHPRHFTDGPDVFIRRLSDSQYRQMLKDEMLSPPPDFESPWLSCGGPDGIGIGDCAITQDAQGNTLAQYAAKRGLDPFDALFDLIAENNMEVLGIYHEMNDSDVAEIIKAPYVLFGCDSAAPYKGTAGHPRTFGTFTRVLGRYCRERRILPMEAAIHRMTGLTAQTYGFTGKGVVAPGKDADLVLFSREEVLDMATYENPEICSRGIEQVWVNGQTVYRNGKLTGAKPGRALLRGC